MSDPKRRVKWVRDGDCECAYLETVPFRAIAIFTAIQLACLLGIWAITVWSGLFGISFPLWIMALVPLRRFVLPKLLKHEDLQDLDRM